MYPRPARVAERWLVAAPLNDPQHLRHQALFLIGAGGSGKGYQSYRWLKYMPGGGSGGVSREEYDRQTREPAPLSPRERLLSDLDFSRAVRKLQSRGFHIELADDPATARIPFEVYDASGGGKPVPRERWAEVFPADVLREIEGVEEVVFSGARAEVPSYWRQVNPDTYKEELPGFRNREPGYVHEMSSVMSKAYLEAALATGDPVIVDGTGSDAKKVREQVDLAQSYGYRTSLVFVFVPLTVNQIRNATRPRTVNPDEITRQWGLIRDSFSKLRSAVDRAKVIDARHDATDFASYRKNAQAINSFVAQKTHYGSLYELIAAHAPEELSSYGALLSGS